MTAVFTTFMDDYALGVSLGIANEQMQRANVVRIALEWERTPYIHQGRIKGKAADCTFFAKVFEEAGLMPAVEIPPYSHQAHLNRQGSMYLPIVERCARQEIKQNGVKPGDVVMYHVGRAWSHGGIVLDWPVILHADMGAGFVIRAEGDQGHFLDVPRRFFSFW